MCVYYNKACGPGIPLPPALLDCVTGDAHPYGDGDHAPAAIDAATKAGAIFVLLLFASVIITNRSISATKLPASAFFHS